VAAELVFAVNHVLLLTGILGLARSGAAGTGRLGRAGTLICGIAVFVIVIPGIFGPFLAGRLALTAWMLMLGALGLALYTQPPARPQPS
jgi:hypothetical protein